MSEYMEWQEVARRMSEESDRMAQKYPWWRLLFLRLFDRAKYRKAVHARLYGE